MSGGSFDYLCFKDAGEVLAQSRDAEDGDIAAMRDALLEYGDTEDVAAETEQLRLDLRAFRVRIDAKLTRLQPVWRSVEWHHSGDSGPEGVRKAVEQYRGGS